MIVIDDSLLPIPPAKPPRRHRESQEKRDVPETNFGNNRQPAKPVNWAMIVIVGLLAYMAFGGLHCDRVNPGPSPNPIDDKGKYAMILKDNDNLESMTTGQKAALSSVKISQWCRDNKFEFRKIDTADDVSKMEPIWGTLKNIAKSAPSLTISVDGSPDSNSLPDGIDATIRVLESVK